MTDDASFLGTVPDGAGLASAGVTVAEQTDAPADDQPKQEPVYTSVEDWVIDYFLAMFRRTLGGEFRWCAQWWRHGEAISRLRSLWHSWEVLRLRPGTGIATWYRDYLDHQLPILMGARGPFYQCSETAHREPHEATALSAPAEWWDTDEAVDGGPASMVPTVAVNDGGPFGPPGGAPVPEQIGPAGAGEDHA